MSDDESFRSLIRRIRARDEQAAAELVRRYEPTIRVAVRVRLSDPKLRRLWDSMDVCQSVLANSFARAASGQFELEAPDQFKSVCGACRRRSGAWPASAPWAARGRRSRRKWGKSPTPCACDSNAPWTGSRKLNFGE